MTKLPLDINQFGKIHWLSPLGKFDRRPNLERNREKWRAEQRAKMREPGKIEPVEPSRKL